MSGVNMATSTKKRFTIPTLDQMSEDSSSKKNENQFSTFNDTNPVLEKPKTKTSNQQSGPAATTSNTISQHFIKKPETISSTSDHNLQKNDGVRRVPAEPSSSNQAKSDDIGTVPALAKIGSTNSVVVNPRQRGNPVLKHIRNIPWEYGNIIPDYVMGHATCALFLSLRYHQLHANYVHDRLKSLGKSFDLRVLLVQVDIVDPHHLLKELSKICILADCTLILAFTAEEAGRYLETYKIFENKSPEAIMERTDGNFMTKLTDSFTTVKSVNKTDCVTLISAFKTVDKIMKADKEDLGLCPGFGPQKAKRLYDVLHEPFLKYKKKSVETVQEK